jgi:hypothetical protein
MPKFFKRLALAALIVALVCFGQGWLGSLLPRNVQSVAQAQPRTTLRRVDPVAIATQLYQTHPDLPTENTYHQSNGTPAPNDTLISRLIRYHLYTKERPANLYLDWKLTLADYLGAFDPINSETYPSASTLTTHPLPGDALALSQLTWPQRQTIVQFLVETFTRAPQRR